jgi:hypothetical protein
MIQILSNKYTVSLRPPTLFKQKSIEISGRMIGLKKKDG